jgi:crotonobetainyl-CoA:carnitine CoA-transferase CaiB-like acyl-CoA transferase
MSAPLEGIRVLDLSRVLAGPFAAMGLADLGADVVKVERPGAGDDTRSFGPPYADGVSTYFLSVNRGKRSVTLDLKSAEGRAHLKALAGATDVLLENFRPGVMERLGLGPEELRALNPRLVYCAISGFGQDRPGPGYDLVVQGLSGIPSITGSGEAPNKCGASIADLSAGMNAVSGILAALVRRERTGVGGVVDVSMLDGQLALLSYHASGWLNGGVEPTALGNAHPSIHPFCGVQTADGWLNLAVGNDAQFQKLCQALSQTWHEDSRFATNADRVRNREALNLLMEPVFWARTTADWQTDLAQTGIPMGPMKSIPEALEVARLVEHDHPEGAGRVRTVANPYTVDGEGRGASRRAPRLGEHTDEVLAEWIKA